MKNNLMLAAVLGVFFGVALWAAPAYAQGGGEDVFELIKCKLANLFENLKEVIYIAAGLVFIGFAVAGMFGKIEWKKVAVLASGLFLVVIATAAIDYFATDATGAGFSGEC